jgi:hypothetical protein
MEYGQEQFLYSTGTYITILLFSRTKIYWLKTYLTIYQGKKACSALNKNFIKVLRKSD